MELNTTCLKGVFLCYSVAGCVISLTWGFVGIFFFLVEILSRKSPNPKAHENKIRLLSYCWRVPVKINRLLEFHLCQWQNNNTWGKISFVFPPSGWEERSLHAIIQRRFLRGVEGAASLWTRPAVSPVSLLECNIVKTSQEKPLSQVTLNPELEKMG